MLTVDNNDTVGIEEFGMQEELEFWEVARCLSFEEMFPWLDEDEILELELLAEDYRRVMNSGHELKRLVPRYAHKTHCQMKRLVKRIERRIKTLVRHNIHYRKAA